MYFAKQIAFERFILLDGGVYPALFWWGYVVAGSLLPLALIYHPRFGVARASLRRRVAAGRSPARFALLYVVHHRRAGVPAGDLPRLRSRRSSFGDGEIAHLRAAAARVAAGPRRRGASPS